MDPLSLSYTIANIITYFYYTNNTLMQMEGRIQKFYLKMEKFQFLVFNVKGPFKVDNLTFHKAYEPKHTHFRIFLINYLRYA